MELRPSPTAVARFSAKYVVDPSGCWLWSGAVQRDTGYGRFGMNSARVEYAHRAAWLLFRGPIPEGLCVCHRCDVRICVNPEHLFLGTAKDNMRDASTKGRIRIPRESFASDERHQVARLSNAQVREIRSSRESSAALARSGRFPVGHSAICYARRGATFRGVS